MNGKRKHKRKKSKKSVKCTICTPYRWLGNSKDRFKHKDRESKADLEARRNAKTS